MRNYIQPGRVLTMIAPTGGVVGGVVYIFGKIFGVAAVTAAEGKSFELATGEVYELPKVAAQAWTVGQEIFWDPATKLATNVAGSLTKIGVAISSAANPSGVGVVRLNYSF